MKPCSWRNFSATMCAIAIQLAANADDHRKTITFAHDIAPIIFAHCAPCHHTGGPAPFALMSFDDAQKRDKMIAKVTGDRYMPPWLPAKPETQFLGERRLSDEQIQLIQQWVNSGAAAGDP